MLDDNKFELKNSNFDFMGTEFITIKLDDEIYFSYNQTTDFLEYQNKHDALRLIDEKDFKTLKYKDCSKILKPILWRSDNDFKDKRLINEYALYDLVSHSQMPLAREFQRHITHVVIPSIRKNGMYATPQTANKLLNDPDSMIKILQNFKDAKDENKRLNDENKLMKPKARLADAITDNKTLLSMDLLGTYVKQAGFKNMGRNNLMEYCREKGLLTKGKHGQIKNRPTARATELGIFKDVLKYAYTNKFGLKIYEHRAVAYPKAIKYFIDRFEREKINRVKEGDAK